MQRRESNNSAYQRVEMEAAHHEKKVKWVGKAIAELKSCKAEHVWPLWAEFCGIYKWYPNLVTSSLVHGVRNEVGSVRHNVEEVVEGREAMWAKEKLLEVDNDKRLMRYEVLENSVGLEGYVATIRVYDEKGLGCMVEWRFEADAVEGWGEEGFHGYVQSSLDFTAKKMEDAVTSL